MSDTLKGIGPGGWDNTKPYGDNKLRREPSKPQSVLYRIYTENRVAKPTIEEMVSRYFAGATIFYGIGLWFDTVEPNATIEILGTFDDLQSIAHLAGDIKVVNHQQSVLVTWSVVNRLDV